MACNSNCSCSNCNLTTEHKFQITFWKTDDPNCDRGYGANFIDKDSLIRGLVKAYNMGANQLLLEGPNGSGFSIEKREDIKILLDNHFKVKKD